jgi:hypothetical protein
MIGKIIHKNNEAEMAEYAATAIWCNSNNAMIEDRGEYYEVIAIPEPSMVDKIAMLDANYNQQKADLINEYTDAQIHGDEDAIALVQEEMTALDEWYDEEYRKIEEENEEGE